MYYLYQKLKSEDVTQYSFLNKVKLFGCNEGYVPQMLKRQLNEDSSEPLQWHVNIESGLREKGQDNQTLIIDLKPKSQSFSFYEILNVWGYSDNGWTRVMLHLNGLFIDDDRGSHNENDFTRTPADVDGPIFTMMYLIGTIKDGGLVDRWTGPAARNSVLLWPDVFEHFWKLAEYISRK